MYFFCNILVTPSYFYLNLTHILNSLSEIDEVLISTNFFSDVYSTLIVIKLNGVRFNAEVDSLSLSDSSNKFGDSSEIAHSSNVSGDTSSNSNDTVPNKQLQKFVEYVSYLKFLVTFVARDVNLRVDTKDDQDPITAASFEASGRLS